MASIFRSLLLFYYFANWRTYLQQRILDLLLREKWGKSGFPRELGTK
jgi:hypothetical protein